MPNTAKAWRSPMKGIYLFEIYYGLRITFRKKFHLADELYKRDCIHLQILEHFTLNKFFNFLL